jgi:hypothetical protein
VHLPKFAVRLYVVNICWLNQTFVWSKFATKISTHIFASKTSTHTFVSKTWIKTFIC